MRIEIRGLKKYPMPIFWLASEQIWLDILPAGSSGVSEWKRTLREAGYCVGVVKLAEATHEG